MHKATAPSALALCTALLLTACGGDPSPQVDPQPTQPQPTEQAGNLSGQITPWTGQASSVHPVNASVATPGPAFTAPVNAAGQFDLTLPDVATMNSSYANDQNTVANFFNTCPVGQFQTDAPASLKIVRLNMLETDTKHQLVASSNGGNTVKEWWFANEDATFHMSGTGCINGNFDTTLSFKRGWNVVDTTFDGKTSTFAVSSAPTTRMTWTDTSTGMGSLALKYSFLKTWVRTW